MLSLQKSKKLDSMNIRKSLIIVLVTLTIPVLHAQSTDVQLNALLGSGNFFKLKEEYPKLKEKSSEAIQLFVEAYLGSYFNQPEQANENIRLIFQFYSEYPDIFTPELQLSLYYFMAENEARIQNYKNAASIYAQLIEQLADFLDINALNAYKEMYRFYNSLQNVSQMEISYTGTNKTIPLKRDTVGLLTLSVNSNNLNENFDFVLDFGAGFCMVEEKYANSLGIKVLADSVFVRTGIGTVEYSKMGIADEITIGDVKVKNVIFNLSPDKIVDKLPDSISNYKITGIIGFPVLRAFGHLIITDSQLVISKSPVSLIHSSNMMMCGNELYVQTVSAEDTLLMLFDSGSGDSYLTSYYLSNRDINKENLEKSTRGRISYGGMREFEIYKKADFSCQIGVKEFVFPSIDIHIENFQVSTLLIDGVIGQDVIKQSSATIIDFKNMYFQIK